MAIAVTYARVSPDVLYHVDDEGLRGGLGRTVVFLNFPTALVAIALAWLAVAALADGLVLRVVAALATVLCAVVVVPGVVDQGDLDAQPVNAVPALGVALAAVLTAASTRRAGVRLPRKAPGDRLRLVVAAVVLVASLPWIVAELGGYIGPPFLAEEIWRSPETGEVDRAVHVGHHHGLDGALLVLTALLLTRPLSRLPASGLRTAISIYLGLMLAYGAANAAQDFWLEQVVKRGWVDDGLPSMTRPSFGVAWLAIVAVGVALHLLVLRRLGREPAPAS